MQPHPESDRAGGSGALVQPLGQFDHARKALQIAVRSPDSRYILRISSRFLCTWASRRSPRPFVDLHARAEDPWLMAALLAASTLADRPMPGRNVARRIIESGRFRPVESSDLVSELGTLDLKAGDDRRARKLFKQSLEAPTDNSLAQGEWASDRLTNMDVHVTSFNVPFAAEAVARDAAQRGSWEIAPLNACFGSTISRVRRRSGRLCVVRCCGRDRVISRAEAMAQIGMRANPTDSTVANNFWPTRPSKWASSARLSYHSRLLWRTPPIGPLRIAALATSDSLSSGAGNVAGGRDLYRRSIDFGETISTHSDAEVMARAMLVREEVRWVTLQRPSSCLWPCRAWLLAAISWRPSAR